MSHKNHTDRFYTGVNYWASHAGIFMWQDWNENAVREDFCALKAHGVHVLRVFPLWSDFQPVIAAMTSGPYVREFRMADDSWPSNPHFLEEKMMERFLALCAAAEEYDLKLIVGLLTGWMSGRLFVPPFLQEKKIYSDPDALYFQQLFLQGFIRRTKHHKAILAWDLGNECNCMQYTANRQEAASWTAMVATAIRAEDSTRMVISGMHSLEPEGVWTVADQGYWTDQLTTHPYPYWVPPCSHTPIDSYRTLLSATAQTEYYAGLGQKKCMVEELGTMGPMVCDDEIAGKFLWANLWSNWAHGAPGLLWWCGFDQNLLTRPPYDWNMCERELGLLRSDRTPKPVAETMRCFVEQQQILNITLPEKQTDAVCILTMGQQQWPIAYMSYLLAKQAGITLRFVWQEQDLPDSPVYMLPSIKGAVMSKRRYDALLEKVRQGATLYISIDNAILTEFEEVTGFRLTRWSQSGQQGQVKLKGKTCAYRKECSYEFKPTTADVILTEESGAPVLGKHTYGKGQVILCALPIERIVLEDPEKIDEPWYEVYQHLSSPHLIEKTAPCVGLTMHHAGKDVYAVLVNYSRETVETGLTIGKQLEDVRTILGNPQQMEPFGVAILHGVLSQSVSEIQKAETLTDE